MEQNVFNFSVSLELTQHDKGLGSWCELVFIAAILNQSHVIVYSWGFAMMKAVSNIFDL